MNQAPTHFYDVQVHWENKRKGTLSADELHETITVATPPEFSNGMSGIWSPEHLLIAAVNSCLMTTFLAIAENYKLGFAGFESKASGKLEMIEGKYMISEIELKPTVIIEDETLMEKAFKVLHKSEANCLISNSIQSKIIFHPQVKLQTLLHTHD